MSRRSPIMAAIVRTKRRKPNQRGESAIEFSLRLVQRLGAGYSRASPFHDMPSQAS